MALFKISKGNSINLPATKNDGYCYFTTDDLKFYIDWADKNGVINRSPLNAYYADYAEKANSATIASVASALTTNAGSENIPIYFKDGIPVPCGEYLNVNINGIAAQAIKATQDSAGNNITTTYVNVSGDTMTGILNASHKGGSWIRQRDNRGITFDKQGTNTSSWWPWIGGKTPSGDWAIGTLGDSFYISNGTNANYDAGTNTTQTFQFKPNGLFRSPYISVNGDNTSYRFYVGGTSYLNGTATTQTIQPANNAGSTVGVSGKGYYAYYSNTTSAGGGYLLYSNTTLAGRLSMSTMGTTEAGGVARLTLGNNKNNTTADNARGEILMYDAADKYVQLRSTAAGNYIYYFKNHGGTVYSVGTSANGAVGSATQPTYVNANGIITASTSNIGNTKKPIYMKNGVITALSDTIGSGTQPVYMNAGTITTSTSNVGNTTKPMYMVNGILTASPAKNFTIGSASEKDIYSSNSLSWTANEIGYASLKDKGTALTTENLNDITVAGNYYSQNSTVSAALSNAPVTNAGFRLIHYTGYQGTPYDMQIAFNGNGIYSRVKSNNTWRPWGQILNQPELDDRYVNKTGDTMTGSLAVTATGAQVTVEGGNGKVGIYSSTNQGLYDFTNNKWLIYNQDSDNTVRTPNNFYIGKKATIDGDIVIGDDGISYKGTQATGKLIRFRDNPDNAYGNGITIGSAGSTIVGAGESTSGLESIVGVGDESLHLGADGSINFYTACDTFANRKKAVLDGSLYFYPSVTGTGSLGTNTYRWNSLYTNTVNIANHTTIGGNILMSGQNTAIHWSQGGTQQRILSNDSSALTDPAFKFQYSSDSGSTWKDLTTLYGNGNMTVLGNVTAPKFIGKATEAEQTDHADVADMALSQAGKLLYSDCDFKVGNNSVNVYNNSGGSNVTITRITNNIDCPTKSGYLLKITVNGTTTSPGYGGFYQALTSHANGWFLVKYLIKLPVGYKLATATNSMGTNYKDEFITSDKGTGKWEWYVRRVKCGSTGTFSSGGHLYAMNDGGVVPSASAPLEWYLGGIWSYDITMNETKFYGNATTATKLENPPAITIGNKSSNFNGQDAVAWTLPDIGAVTYGTCSSASTATEKVVTIDNKGWTLQKGAVVIVKFTNTNDSSATNVKLNVNGTGAKSIWYNNAVYSSYGSTVCGYANRYIEYMYDGAYWVWMGSSIDQNSTYYKLAVECTTASGTAAKVGNCAWYTRESNRYIYVNIANGNSVQGAITLNINGKGALPIYINGAASSSTNYTLPQGMYLVYCDNSKYYFRTDSNIQGNLAGNASSATKLNTARTLTVGNTGKSFDGTSNVSWSLNEIGAVNKTGDTMSGDLTISKSSGGAYFTATNTSTGAAVWVGIGSGGTNHGLYSKQHSKWIAYADASGSVILNGNANTATKLKNARTIFGKSFDGTGNVQGKGLFYYDTYSGTTGVVHYQKGGIEIREIGQVGTAQSDISYAPSLGFNWSGRAGGSLALHGDGQFYLRKTDGTSTATLNANLTGTASNATKWNEFSIDPDDGFKYKYYKSITATTPTTNWYVKVNLKKTWFLQKDSLKIHTSYENNGNCLYFDFMGIGNKYQAYKTVWNSIILLGYACTQNATSYKREVYLKFKAPTATNVSPVVHVYSTVDEIESLELLTAEPSVSWNTSNGLYTNQGFNGSLIGNADTATRLKDNHTFTVGNSGKSFNGAQDIAWTLPEIGAVSYGTCSTAAGTAAKVVILSNTSWKLQVGAIVIVKFSATNTASSVTLNVNNTGAKSIWYNNAAYTGSSNTVCGYANRYVEYMWDGTYWVWMGQSADLNTTYNKLTVECATSGATAAKVGNCSWYTLGSNRYIYVSLSADNTVQGAITLNINDTGAKPIYINGAASSSTNYTLPKGMYFVYYNGTNYYFRTDSNIQGNLAGNASTASKLATTRSLTVGSTAKNFDGSANVSWSLNEIGALPGKTTSATTAATAQWYRIAQSGADISHCVGTFTIKAECGSNHSDAIIEAGITYGQNPTIIQTLYSFFGAHGISKARVVYHTTYSGNYAYLEVYVPTAKARTISVAYNGYGWTLVSPSTVGSVPSGYTSKEITFVKNNIVSNLTGEVTGNASSATKLKNARTIFGKSFDGTGNVVGQAEVYGTYQSDATKRYSSGALEIREAGLVTNTIDADIGYAPSIGFHWGGRVGGSLLLNSDAIFYLRKQDGTSRATLDANIVGNTSTATKLQVARNINGTAFDGSADIITNQWGTSRALQIGNSSKSVNGAANVTWTLNEIGASDRSLQKNNYVDFTVDGDADTYYPVLINIGYNGFAFGHMNISRGYNWTAPDTWHNSTHKGGLTLAVRWTGDSAWGGNDHVNIIVEDFHEQYSNMVAGMKLSTSGMVVWLRGGTAKYRLNTDNGISATAVPYIGDFTASDKTVYSPRTNLTNVDSEIKSKWHVRASGVQKFATARTINGTNFDGTQNIVTSYWGTARNIKVGNKTKSVNGSTTYDWTLPEIGAVSYGTCDTAAATATKVVNLTNKDWTLQVGAIIVVKSSVTNTASNVKLNVNGTGAKSIWYNASAYTGASADICGYANRYITYMWDGTYWVWLSKSVDNNSTYYTDSVQCTTAGSTAAKVGTTSYYTLASNRYFVVMMQNANSVQGAITLNIKGSGAKPIYINGSVSSASNYTLPAGLYVVYYDGTNYHFRTDGKMAGDLAGNADSATIAATASALTTNAGSANKPVYFKNGIPVECGEYLNVNINGSATKLATARKIGKASFDGTANITASDILDRARLSGSGTANKNKYIKFARITLTSAWQCVSGTLNFTDMETISAAQGQLNYYFRNSSTIATTSIRLNWVYLTDTRDEASVVAVKVSDGVYDLYYKPSIDYDTRYITNIDCTNPSCIELEDNSTYVASVTAAATSSLLSKVSYAKEATKATQDNDGNVIKNTYAKLAAANNMIHSGNEWTVVPNAFSGALWLNYRTVGGFNGAITQYNMGNGNQGYANVKANKFIGALEGNATTATTATNLAANPAVKWNNGTTTGPTLQVTAGNKTSAAVAVPSASATTSGVITTTTQTIAGDKTMTDDLSVQGTVTIGGGVTLEFNATTKCLNFNFI